MVEGGGLENRFRFTADVGSNPTPSAIRDVSSMDVVRFAER